MSAFGSGAFGDGPFGLSLHVIPPTSSKTPFIDLLPDLPLYLQRDPLVQRVMTAYGWELGRIDYYARAVLAGFLGSEMSDVPVLDRYLAPVMAMWEKLLGLPVQPAGATTAERRAKVLAYIQKRNSGSGSDWVTLLQLALGATVVYEEGPGDYQVTFTLPIGSPYTLTQVQALARDITPAHLTFDTIDPAPGDARLKIGISKIGDTL
jgi:hypothetical protein